jgi:hypothetical protein
MLTQSTPSPHDAILSVSNHGPDTAALRMGNWKLIVNAASQKSAQPEGKGPRSKKGQTKYEPVALYDLSSARLCEISEEWISGKIYLNMNPSGLPENTTV